MMRVFVYEHLSGAGSAIAGAELLGAGLAMRDAVVHDLLRAGDLRVSVAADHAALAVPAAALRVQAQPGTSAADFVAHQARLHDRVWVIAPETDGVLGQLQRAVGAGRWLGCAAEAIALASSKRATLARAAAHRVLTPLAFATSRASSRWVVKPDDGACAVATRVHDTLAAARGDAEARLQRGESATLEAWVAGEPLSLSLLCTFPRGADATRLTWAVLAAGLRTRIGTRRTRRRAFVNLVMPPATRRGEDVDALAASLAPLFGRDLADQPPIVMAQLRAMGRFDAFPRLAALAAVPTLVLSARHDVISRPALGPILAGAIPGARFVEIADAGHGVTIQRGAVVNVLLAENMARADGE